MNAVVEAMPGEDDLEERKSVAQIERQALAVDSGQPVIPVGVSPLVAMLARGQLQVEHVEKAMELQEKHDSYEAKQAFSAALAKFRSQVENIKKDREGHHKGTFYATLGAVTKAISGPLSDNGLSYYWTSEQESGQLNVTCHVTHALGHSIQTSMVSPPDTQGGKSAIQALASAQSYLRRYTLCGLLGLATEDNDGAGAGNASAPTVETLTDSEIRQVVDMLAAAEDAIPGTKDRWQKMRGSKYMKGNNDLGLLVPRSSFNMLIAELKGKIDSAKESGE